MNVQTRQNFLVNTTLFLVSEKMAGKVRPGLKAGFGMSGYTKPASKDQYLTSARQNQNGPRNGCNRTEGLTKTKGDFAMGARNIPTVQKRPIPIFVNGRLTEIWSADLSHNLLPFIPSELPWKSEDERTEYFICSAHAEADAASSKPGWCYFIGGEEGPVKIGMSVTPNKRLLTIQAHSPVRLSILALADGGSAREHAYHLQFASHRLHGEWFSRCPEIEVEIARLSNQGGR